MVVERKLLTADEFDEFALLPENAERLLELIGGEVVEAPSNPYSSAVAARLLVALGIFLKGKNLGHLTGEGGGYMVSGERYAPDVAFISKERQPELPHGGYNPNPPDLAVEVFSPTDSEKSLRIKLANYLAAGTLVWVVYPETREVEVYAPGQPVRILDITGALDGEQVLPGFRLEVADLFAEG